MALTFGAVTSDAVGYGSAAGLDALDPITYILWLKPTTLTSGRLIVNKGTTAKRVRLSGTGGNVEVLVNRATTNTSYITNTTPLVSTGTWIYLACTFNSAGGAGQIANVYKGTLSAVAAEATYGTATDGVDAVTDDSANSLQVGGSSCFQGDIALFHVLAAELTLAQIIEQQFRPRPLASTRLFSHLGFPGVGTQPDWSGNGNNGTVTGATQADHVPLGAPFPQRALWVPTGAGAPPPSGGPARMLLMGVG